MKRGTGVALLLVALVVSGAAGISIGVVRQARRDTGSEPADGSAGARGEGAAAAPSRATDEAPPPGGAAGRAGPPPIRRPRARARDEAAEAAAREHEALRAAGEVLRAGLRRRLAAGRPAGGGPIAGAEPDGPWEKRDANGEVVAQGEWKDGERHGLWIERNADGSRSETEYRNGLKHGREATWFTDGTPRFLGFNTNGEATGVWTSWHRGGVLASTREFVLGSVHGVMRTFHANGAVESESVYEFGRDAGPSYGWRADGSPEFVMPYVDGRRHGEALWYHPNGSVAARGTYVGGGLHGEYITYDESGAETSVELWEGGSRVRGPGDRSALARRGPGPQPYGGPGGADEAGSPEDPPVVRESRGTADPGNGDRTR